MALSGSLNTSPQNAGRYLQFAWTATQNATKNQSTISWTLKAVGGSYNTYKTSNRIIKLDGSTIWSKSTASYEPKGTVATGSFTLTHDANGEKSFTIYVSAKVASKTETGTKTFTLDTITPPVTPDTGKMNIKLNGAWENGQVYIKVNGTWQEAEKVYIKLNGTWEEATQ